MIVVADAGSTKTDWALIHDLRPTEIITSPGINPLLTDRATLFRTFAETLRPILGSTVPISIHYYGAGCIPEIIPDVQYAISEATGCQSVSVASDLLGAARALCGDTPGIACILGTGSNSCLYDGSRIIDAVPAMGFILGDEGSGASIGRRFLSDIFKRQLAPDITDLFTREQQISVASAIDRVYRQPAPNRFLASLLPFISSHISHPQLDALLTDEFVRFLKRNVAGYTADQQLPVNFTGSIALHFRPQLEKALSICGMRLGTLLQAPIEGLIAYHTDLAR